MNSFGSPNSFILPASEPQTIDYHYKINFKHAPKKLIYLSCNLIIFVDKKNPLSEVIKNEDPLKPASVEVTSTAMHAAAYVLELFNEEHDNRLLYHNYQRTAEVARRTAEIAEAINLDDESTEIALISAWFHNTGYLLDYANPIEASQQAARSFLEEQQYPAARISKVIASIRSLKMGMQPEAPGAQVLSDAIQSVNNTSRFFQQRPLLRLEQELVLSKKMPTLEWEQLQLQHLLGTRFYTAHGKNNYESFVGQNILMQKEKTEKSRLAQLRNPSGIEEGHLRKFQQLERKLPTSAIQTFFRTNYRNHINLSAIADNKANIMISVNAILISVIISVLSYRNLSETNPIILLPAVIFLMTALTSLIFAVLSIRPKVTSLNEGATTLEAIKKNVIYFGNFVNLELEQYEEAMDTIFRNGELLYGNMTRDLYYLGKVLDKKYRYLTMAYNIFMVGFVAAVGLFLVAMFM